MHNYCLHWDLIWIIIAHVLNHKKVKLVVNKNDTCFQSNKIFVSNNNTRFMSNRFLYQITIHVLKHKKQKLFHKHIKAKRALSFYICFQLYFWIGLIFNISNLNLLSISQLDYVFPHCFGIHKLQFRSFSTQIKHT